MWLTLAFAADLDPLWQTTRTGVTVLAGAESDESVAPWSAVRAGGLYSQQAANAAWALGGWTSWQIEPGSVQNLHGVWAEAGTGPWSAGATVRASGLGTSPWAEASSWLGWNIAQVQLSAGPALRAGTLGMRARASSQWALGDWRLRVGLDSRVWRHSLPARASGRVTVETDVGRWQLAATGAGWATGATEKNVWVAGISPSTQGLTTLLSAERPAGPVTARAELRATATRGEYPDRRVTVAAGVRWGRTQSGPTFQPDDAGYAVEVHLPDADDVQVAGSWNDWTPQPLERATGGVWRRPLDLPPGRYELVLLVDGRPMPVPGLPTVPDGFGGHNAVLVVP